MKRNVSAFVQKLRTRRFFIALISVISAVAIGITCALCFGTASNMMSVDGVDNGSANESAVIARSNPTSGTDFTTVANMLFNADTITYTDASKVYSLKLPAGKYKLEVYGGAGGANGAGESGGNGGSSITGMTLSAATTLYIFVGAKGGDASGVTGGTGGKTAGSANGAGGNGGVGRSGANASSVTINGNNGGGGGGAKTYVSTNSGCNATTTCIDSDLLALAGGGGGRGGRGNGGSPNVVPANSGGTGGAGHGNGNGGTGGASTADDLVSNGGGGATQSAVGAGGTRTGSSTSSKDGVYYPGGGGGGGAGYYGGGGGAGGSRKGNSGWTAGAVGVAGGTATATTNNYGKGGNGGNGAARATGYYSTGGGGGGGGSGYLKNGRVGSTNVTLGSVSVSNKYVSMTVNQSYGSSNTGAGYVKITVLELNKDPIISSTVYTCGTSTTNRWARGTYSYDITPSAIASDPENQALYFTNGTSTDLDAWSSAKLYLNSNCTTTADNYVTYGDSNGNVVSTSQRLRIKEIKRYPRKNVDGCTEDGKLRLYVRVRDNYGTVNGTTNANATQHRGYAVVYFDIYVSPDVVAPCAASTQGSGLTEYRVGKSNQTSTTYDYRDTANAIYNTATNRDTVFISAPLTSASSAGVTIDVSKVFRVLKKGTETATSPTVSSYDVAGISKVTLENGTETNATNGTYYTVTYNADSTTYGSSGLYKSITVKPKTTAPNIPQYITLRLYAKACEKSTKVAIGDEKFVYLTFCISNTRPYYVTADKINKITTTAISEPNYTLTVGEVKDINVSALARDRDGHTLTFVTGTSASNIKVPANEYIPVTKQNVALSLKSSSNYYGLSGNSVVGSVNTNNTATTSSWYTGTGAATTGFGSSNPVLAATGSAAASKACVTYTYVDNNTLRLTARAATQFQYDRSKYSNTTEDGKKTRNGDFYFMVRLQDAGDTSDSGIWFPISIKVTSKNPEKLAPTANFTLGFNYTPSETDDQGDPREDAKSTSVVQYLSPISYSNTSGVLNGVGAPDSQNYATLSAQAQPFVKDPDAFSYGQYGNNAASDACTHALNDVVVLDGSTVGNGSNYTVNTYDTSPFFSVQIVPLYSSASVFNYMTENNRVTAAELSAIGISQVSASTRYTFNGLKITPYRSTGDNFYQIDVKVLDTHGKKATIPVYIKVENRSVNLRRVSTAVNNDNSATKYPFGLVENVSEFKEYDSSIGSSYISYSMEAGGEVKLTPYDFAYDFDVANGKTGDNNTDNYSMPNAASSNFAAAADVILSKHSVKSVASASAASPSNTTSVTCQTIDFTDTSDIDSKANGIYSDYIDYKKGVQNGIPCITIKAKSRTGAENIRLRFLVGDEQSAVMCTISVTINNGAPELSSGLKSHYSLTAGTPQTDMPNAWEFSISGVSVGNTNIPGLVFDKDGDSPSFVPGSPRIVAKIGDSYYPALDEEYNGVEFINDPSAKYLLSSYATVTLTKSTQSGAIGMDVIRVTGLSSTQTLPVPVYLEFKVTDKYEPDIKISTLRVQIEVINSVPKAELNALTLDNTLIKVDNEDKYIWQIQYEQQVEKGLARYIVNSAELSNSSAISASAKNKIVLFSDADALQLPLLSPKTRSANFSSSDYVAPYRDYGTIPEGEFDNRGLAAVMYTPTYETSSDVSNKYLSISVEFFERTIENGAVKFTKVERATSYWAIKITEAADGGAKSSDNGVLTHIAIAVCDNHNGVDVYNGGTHASNGQTGDSDVKVLNFYYQYKSPGLIAMHETYRNDAISESGVLVDGYTDLYSVDYDYLYAYQFKNGTKPTPASNSKDDKKDAVSQAEYSEGFQYQYFVNSSIHKDGEGDDAVETPVSRPKTFALSKDTTFYYRPISIPVDGSVEMPISYIAMPKTFSIAKEGGGTEGGNHVTFANAGNSVGGDIKLADSSYATWGKTNANVFANLALTDGITTWRGSEIANNPYIDIEYNGSIPFTSDYINKYYAELEESGNSYSYKTIRSNGAYISMPSSSIFREDKFGFTFKKSANGKRPAGNGTSEFPVGTLKLSVDLKTLDNNSSGEARTVSVKLNIANSAPVVSLTGSENSSYNLLNMEMTAANASGVLNSTKNFLMVGKYVELYSSDTNIPQVDNTHRNSIQYTDADKSDVMKFYLPSAASEPLGSVMSEDQIKYIEESTAANKDGSLVSAYFKDINDDVATSDSEKAAFEPNPNYKKFFNVSPENGSSEILQFVPVAKTQLNLAGKTEAEKAQILKDNNLKKDSNGIYYPFKVLSYDDISGSGFGNGDCCWALTVIKVYIKNDPLTADTTKVSESTLDAYAADGKTVKVYEREISLSKGSPIALDVSTLLKDADMQYNGAAFALASETAYSALTDAEKLVKDYLTVPQTTVNDDGEAVPTSKKSSGSTDSVKVCANGTSYTFEATSAFKKNVELTYEFADTAGDKVAIKFVLKYKNEAPKLNSAFGNNSINIVMHTGDSFTLHVSEVGEKAKYEGTTDRNYTNNTEYYFGSDMQGGYVSPSAFTKSVNSGTISDYPLNKTAEDLYDDFAFFAGSEGTGTDLILGDDDAPSTLRFNQQNNHPKVGSFVNPTTKVDSKDYFEVTPKNFLSTESILSQGGKSDSRPMSVTIKAKGVANTPYIVEIADEGEKYTITLNITVLPTAPKPIENATALSAIGLTPVTGENNTYSLKLKYGEVFDKPIRYDSKKTGADNGFITDIDFGDERDLFIPAVYGGDYFSVVNPNGGSAISASTYSNRLAISANDLIMSKDDYADVAFRVSDSHGEVSDEIHIRVYVEPEDIEVRAVKNIASTTNLISLKSYADYYEDGMPTVVDLISDNADTKLVYDKASSAESAAYDVRVYAMLKMESDKIGTAEESEIDKSAALIIECLQPRVEEGVPVAGSVSTPRNTDIQLFVKRFFDVSITSDGKTLMFAPRSASINPIDTIRFYIEIGKRCDWTDPTSGDERYVLNTKSAFMSVAVKNSAPIAVQEAAENYGYPHSDISTDNPVGNARGEGFLTFVGTAGSSLSWDLYNSDNINRGLFYDYDMVNTDANASGRDTLNYVDYSYSVNEGTTGGQTYEQLNGRILTVKYDKGKVSITINRKARVSQPSASTPAVAYVDIPVEIRCADSLGMKASPKVYSTTTINVRVENDPPEFKETGDNSSLGYKVTYNEDFGEYFMEASIATDKTLTVNINDILRDKDIDIDVYYFEQTGDSDFLSESTTTLGNSTDRNMFRFSIINGTNKFSLSTMTGFSFRCLSVDRGATATCTLKLKDSTHSAQTSKMTITLTVDNTAPKQSVEDIVITVMGLAPDAAAPERPAYVGNIVEYVSDINPKDCIDVTPDPRPDDYVAQSNTYVYIESISVNKTTSADNKPFIYGAGVVEKDPNDDKSIATTSVCDVIWAEYDTHQTFGIMLSPGVYGTQPVTFTVRDSGYNDGVRAGVIDGLQSTVTVKIIVMRPIDDIELPSFDIAYKVRRSVTPELLLNTEEEQHNADGYVISNIVAQNDSLVITSETAEVQSSSFGGVSASSNATRWFITADKMSSDAKITVTFGVSGGSVSRDIAINITENNQPIMRPDAKGVFNKAELNDDNMITITPSAWFTDPDIDDVMRFVTPLKVKIGAYAEAHLDGSNIVLKFLGRGETELSFNISDMSGRLYSHTITIGCNDMEELSFFGKALAMVQENPLLYGLIAGGVLLLIIVLIIIIVVVHKKRKMRAEIEALLNSETELEEEMMRLSGGVMQYQSYGYLPPTAQTMNDPGLMLGSAANNPPPNNLQLNAGMGQQPQQQPVKPNAQSVPSSTVSNFGANGGDSFDPNDF